ncbi:hypothetical protein B0T17DRAFT_509008 [Bombardia bombarda]|uniref:Uncharacterized protein n=1 Tax=Bombardia bombarda TaxID=252184 RepID=A0AA40C1U3_9PEZI|nr:hypothetical protein B0T17DRAFT_509008 [Bombardia bombarda]
MTSISRIKIKVNGNSLWPSCQQCQWRASPPTLQEVLLMQVKKSSEEFPNSFAMASTHLARTELTLAVILGVDESQMERITELLEQYQIAIGHPQLALALYAELQRDRLCQLVDENVQDCKMIARELEHTFTTSSEMADVDLINSVRECQMAGAGILEEIEAVKRHLIKSLPGPPRQHEATDSLESKSASLIDKFNRRFADIFAEFEALAAKIQRYATNMTVTEDTIRNESARRDTQAGIRAANSSTVLAVVAMVYLPMSTVARGGGAVDEDSVASLYETPFNGRPPKPQPVSYMNNDATTNTGLGATTTEQRPPPNRLSPPSSSLAAPHPAHSFVSQAVTLSPSETVRTSNQATATPGDVSIELGPTRHDAQRPATAPADMVQPGLQRTRSHSQTDSTGTVDPRCNSDDMV